MLGRASSDGRQRSYQSSLCVHPSHSALPQRSASRCSRSHSSWRRDRAREDSRSISGAASLRSSYGWRYRSPPALADHCAFVWFGLSGSVSLARPFGSLASSSPMCVSFVGSGTSSTFGVMSEIRLLVLVEGESDADAVRALSDLIGCDLRVRHIQICSARGVTNFSQVLREFARAHPNARFCGMYDLAEQQYVRRALSNAAVPIAAHDSLESFGFFACVADLEEELIRALGAEAVERVLEAQGELVSFRRFQAMPQQRLTPIEQQLRRFLGTRATRKIRSARHLVERLNIDRLPRPLVQLATRMLEH